MISKTLLGQFMCAGLVSLALMGCNKKPEPIKTTDADTIQATQSADTSTKSENDLYIERLNKDVKIENPDALLDAVNTDTRLKN